MTDNSGLNPHPRGPLHARPLEKVGSIKIKFGVIIVATVCVAVIFTWIGWQYGIGASRTLPLSILGSLVITQLLARGMTSPLREMTAAAKEMARGDYSTRVTTGGNDEVGQLAIAFNRMAAELGSTDKARREMIANVSHELRTPVAALRAQLENMVDGVTEPTEAELTSALTQTERLGRLIAYLLDQSRIEAGAIGLVYDDIPLRSFFEDALKAVPPRGSSGVPVQWTISVTPPGLTVPADRDRLHQVLFNLAQNAVRHSPPGGTVAISARRRGEQVVIEVSDEGPGIPPAQRARVFERFARGEAQQIPDAEATATSGGTGLGLSISQWIIELHHGTIGVVDTAKGCTIRITLPARRDTPEFAKP